MTELRSTGVASKHPAAGGRRGDRGSGPRPLALIVDWGGVLTAPLADAMGSWCAADGIDFTEFAAVMRDLLGADAALEAATNPIHALERGELAVPHFERHLAARLRTRDGRPVAADGLLTRMFAGFRSEPAMVSLVRRARRLGLRTGLLSNSWGVDYPREDWHELFDAVVISGEVGMRKPDPEIYRYAARRLRLAPQSCVMVDDLPPNVRGAVTAGMVGVHHVTVEQTTAELVVLFGLPLDGRPASVAANRPG